MRPIDADELSRKIQDEYHGSYSEVQIAPYQIDRMIDAQPTVATALINGVPPVQPKTEPCEDAISRQAVLNTLNNMDSALDEDRTVETYKELLIACYNDLPSVTPAHKKGHWIFVDKAHEHAHCSECGYGNADLFNGRPHNYCPNCGAKMDEEGNG